MPKPEITLTEEANYKLLKLLEQNPDASQRTLARELGMSLGKVNYCLQALISKGHVKAKNFSGANNKNRYLYILTPQGMRKKAEISVRYLKRKMLEYDELRDEIEQLRSEINLSTGTDDL